MKSPQTRQINSSTSPSRFHADPGLHLFQIRVSTSSTPGSPMPFHPGLKKLFKLFLVKEQLVFMKKQAYLIYFVSASEDIWNLIED